LGAIGRKLIIPAERMRPEALYRLFCALREHHGLRIVPADSRESVRELLDALKRNEAVLFLADRYVNGGSVAVPIFGAPALLPTAPMALALRSGAPVFAAYSWRTGPGKQTGVFIPLDVSSPAAGTSADGTCHPPLRGRTGAPRCGPSRSVGRGALAHLAAGSRGARRERGKPRHCHVFGVAPVRSCGPLGAKKPQGTASTAGCWATRHGGIRCSRRVDKPEALAYNQLARSHLDDTARRVDKSEAFTRYGFPPHE
jgi:hypothetical protein